MQRARSKSCGWQPDVRAFWAVLCGLALLIVAPAPLRAGPPERAPDQTLAGTLTARDHQHYRSIPFIVPRGTDALVVTFEHDGRAHKTVIDLGLEDANGLRGTSGGDKSSFMLSASAATPSYLAGPIIAGRWQLRLAIPNIRVGVTTHWQARLWFLKAGEAAEVGPVMVDRGPGWYRGDLHLHTAHSDGTCLSQSGKRVPCPLFKTLETAAARALDFVALTDHNTISHQSALQEAQPWFDRLLLIPGREITTFFGHFNIFGVTAPIDYRITPRGPASFNAIADKVHALGGIISANHPALPSGEICMGCGWTMPAADLSRLDAVEVVNGGSVLIQGGVEGAFSGVPFWTKLLTAHGPRTAIGGSDNHDAGDSADLAGTIGRPTTVVYATGLSQRAVLDGIRAGRVFIDMAGTPGSVIDLSVSSGTARAAMGGRIKMRPNAPLTAMVTAKAVAGSTLELLADDVVIERRAVDEKATLSFTLKSRPDFRIIRAVVRGPDGKIALLSNAVLIDP